MNELQSYSSKIKHVAFLASYCDSSACCLIAQWLTTEAFSSSDDLIRLRPPSPTLFLHCFKKLSILIKIAMISRIPEVNDVPSLQGVRHPTKQTMLPEHCSNIQGCLFPWHLSSTLDLKQSRWGKKVRPLLIELFSASIHLICADGNKQISTLLQLYPFKRTFFSSQPENISVHPLFLITPFIFLFTRREKNTFYLDYLW